MKENYEINWKDYYKILQVDRSAEPEVIKAAYDKLVRKYHPDVNKDAAATEQMKDLNEAFEILGNPIKGMRYSSEYEQHLGYNRGYNEAKKYFQIWYFCSVCGKMITIKPNGKSHEAVIELMQAKGWGHVSCQETRSR